MGNVRRWVVEGLVIVALFCGVNMIAGAMTTQQYQDAKREVYLQQLGDSNVPRQTIRTWEAADTAIYGLANLSAFIVSGVIVIVEINRFAQSNDWS